MKIEIGESLFYSWLRHVKDCTIVQTNWKTSPQWVLQNEPRLQSLYDAFSNVFATEFGAAAEVFKQTSSLTQFLKQAECDVLGVNLQGEEPEYYAVEVAFHESGLNYGSKEATALKVASKCIRIALCLLGYMNTSRAEIIFASPKIHLSQQNALIPCIELVNHVFEQNDLCFHVRLICNHDFQTTVLDPILLVSDNVADTTELFLRSYQMYAMFSDTDTKRAKTIPQKIRAAARPDNKPLLPAYEEFKIGKLANTILREILVSNRVSEEEIKRMQHVDYSRAVFHLQYPVLKTERNSSDSIRYYAAPLQIRGTTYYLCSQWFETPANNDRPYLEKWIADHAE